MPKRTDIKSILILGAGPIVIGQACEFDYSGAQACKALKEEGYRVILVNSNPATIMTDPDMADATYIEPIRWETVESIIETEMPDAILPTMGGQTALNCALDLSRKGVLAKHKVSMIGATHEAIDKAEDRELFGQAMDNIGLETPISGIAHSLDAAFTVLEEVGFPCIIRPSFTMGGSGGGIAYNRNEFKEICQRGLSLSPTNELLIDESLIGWKEYEMEVVRDKNDNCIIICSIENIDPMGIHTGDSITVAPAQTLTDKEYQVLRNASLAVLREIGVETGGSNVQFGICPDSGRMVVIEMNPRVSRSSALASKATGFPIAKIAAKLAVGYTLDELQNEITGSIVPASFEPTLDYVVTKMPRFAFEKFPHANDRLTVQMKSVGEVMAIGRTFQESIQKALRGLETGASGFNPIVDLSAEGVYETIRAELVAPGADRIYYIADAFRAGMTLDDIFSACKIDPWFLRNIQDIVQEEQTLMQQKIADLSKEKLFNLKQKGFSDLRLAQLLDVSEHEMRSYRLDLNIRPVYKRVDSCGAEFSSATAYMYSTYEEECEAKPSDRKKIMVLGGGPNRIGQGIEFDYCCVHAAMAAKEEGFETIMVNCNPETVSTDYDTSDRLYFEPVTLEDVLSIAHVEKPFGVIVQYGGQTPLKLARKLEMEGLPIIGTSPEAIDQAEDRERFQQIISSLGLLQPANATARTRKDTLQKAEAIGYPLIVRPSYVLGGRAMEIVTCKDQLTRYIRETIQVSSDSPVSLDSFLSHAVEVDVDAICDGQQVVIGALMQHIEQAGIHSGDSGCSLPPYSLSHRVQDEIRRQVTTMAMELGVVGLMNVQLAIQDDAIYIIEVNPRASRTVPFVSKCIGYSLAKLAAKVMMGKTLTEIGFTKEIIPTYFCVKEAIFPFDKFPDVDPIPGPEMKSTGEVMGVGASFPEAYHKAQLAAKMQLPREGRAIISIRDVDKPAAPMLARLLMDTGFELFATKGTARTIEEAGLPVTTINKVKEGRPHLVDMIVNGEIAFVVNTTDGNQAISDSYTIRHSALVNDVLYTTTMAGAEAIARAIAFGSENTVRRLQDLYPSP
ncbi:MAG: carbamoyl-phosphate synthase large subunit [Candidatus Endonucleobacter bathymodioli]|uniref:Carbamoyl phosphate synthase large chain n=1 Tax=Candidatus Endonucleibacter bathymodioli TaxID=539814 RepID=A0AA90SY47_9GAMM|nr:carbamoyl-phosphate synthase large subunit [Candidatus Endonucleobacter bathymodioli]